MINNYFKLKENGTTLSTEILAGFTTFLTMAYIIVVNPAILSHAGMDPGAVFIATILASAIGCFIMGLWANYPIALAPTMGMNAYFTYAVVQSMGFSWQVALGAVFISGVLFLLLTLCQLRQVVVDALPPFLKTAISAGIGLFLGVIALNSAGLLIAAPKAIPHLGSLTDPRGWLFLAGFFLISLLNKYRVPGAVLVGIAAVTLTALSLGMTEFHGVLSSPPSLKPVFLALDLKSIFKLGLVVVVLTFFFIGFFDATGTLIGLLHRAGLMQEGARDPRFKKAMMADSVANIISALLGTSVVGCYVESAAGIYAGGRTGLTAVVVGLLFLSALFLSPLVDTIPGYASATALLFVSSMMLRGLKEINWRNAQEAIPSLLTLITTPLTFSIAYGISLGYVSHIILQIIAGKYRDIKYSSIILAILLGAYIVMAT